MILAAYAVPHPPSLSLKLEREEKKIARTSAAYDAVMAEAAAFMPIHSLLQVLMLMPMWTTLPFPQERRPKAALDSLVPLRYASR